MEFGFQHMASLRPPGPSKLIHDHRMCKYLENKCKLRAPTPHTEVGIHAMSNLFYILYLSK
jgi:hypothetical protein